MLTRLLLLFCVFTAPVAYGQRSFSAAQLDTLVIDHPYHCDTRFSTFQAYATSGEERLQLLFLTVTATPAGDSLTLSGQLLEGGPAELFGGTTTATVCDLLKIGETDAQGVFSVRVLNDGKQSLYFISEGYRDAEVKVGRLGT